MFVLYWATALGIATNTTTLPPTAGRAGVPLYTVMRVASRQAEREQYAAMVRPAILLSRNICIIISYSLVLL